MDNQIDESIKKERVKALMDLSKELEISYFNNYINKEVTFIKEVYKDKYLIGHTGNYLLVKVYSEEEIDGEITVKISKVEYPYSIGDLTK